MNTTELVFAFNNTDGIRTWACRGPKLGLHFHVCQRADEPESYYGGLEFHYYKPLAYMAPDWPATHQYCWLLEAPCWHDGSSLYAEETIIPFWLREPENNERMFEFLRKEYEKAIVE